MVKKKESKITVKKLCIAYYRLLFTNKIRRIPRSYFCILQIVSFLLADILGGLCIGVSNGTISGIPQNSFMLVPGIIIISIWVLFIIRANVARFHDIDRTAWFILWGLVPGIGQIALLIIFPAVIIMTFFYGGTQGDNKYGKEFDYDKIESLPSEYEADEDVLKLEEYDIAKSKKPVQKSKDTFTHDSASRQDSSLKQGADFDSEEYWGLISFAYSKIKQTNIFKLWRKEQFDCQFGKCAICNKPMEFRFAQVDHIKPRYKKGTNYSNNLALVHKKCNELKGAKSGYERPDWIKSNKYSEKLDEKVYEITEEIRNDYPTKFPDELFTKPTPKA